MMGGSERLPWDESIMVEVEFGVYPEEETCTSADYSPQIKIVGLKAPYLAIIMDDPDAEMGGFTHWTIWNIPKTGLIPRNIPKRGDVEEPIHALQGRNSYGKIGYSGPCPPEGEEHTYVFRIYGLDGPLDLNHSSTRKDLEKKMVGHILQYGQVEIKFRRMDPVAIGREKSVS